MHFIVSYFRACNECCIYLLIILVLFTVENTDPNCYWLTNYLEVRAANKLSGTLNCGHGLVGMHSVPLSTVSFFCPSLLFVLSFIPLFPLCPPLLHPHPTDTDGSGVVPHDSLHQFKSTKGNHC